MTVRFKIENGKVTDTVSDADAILLPMDKESSAVYMKAKYKTGFLQPLAICDEGIIAESWPTREMFLGDEEEKDVLNKFFPLLKALSFIQGEGRIYGNLAPIHVSEIDEGYILTDLGKGASSDEVNDYTALEFTFFQGEGLPASDVYSVCVMMYEKLTGIHLDNAKDRKENNEVVPLTAFGISEKISEAIAKGLEIYAEDRYETIDELIDAIYDDEKKEALTNDFSILIRPIKQREEEIREETEKLIEEENAEDEKDKKTSAADKIETKKKAMRKIFILIIGMVALIIGAIAIKAALSSEPEPEEPQIKQIKTQAMPIENEIEYDLVTPSPVSGSAVSGGAVSGDAATLTPTPTMSPTLSPTPKPTKRPKATPKPAPRPTPRPQRPARTSRPKHTPRPGVDGGDVVI